MPAPARGHEVVVPDVPVGADGRRRFVQLPTDFDRSPGIGYDAATAVYSAIGLPSSLDAAARAKVVGALVALLHRYTEQPAIALDLFLPALAGAGREGREGQLDAALSGEASASALIAQADAALHATQPRRADAVPASNVAVTFSPSNVRAVDARPPSHAARDLHVVISPPDSAASESSLTVVYNAKLFQRATVDRLVHGLAALLTAIPHSPGAPIGELPILDARAARAVTADQDSGTLTYPLSPVHRIFTSLAARQPAALAGTSKEATLTYGELEARSNRLAHHLIARGVEPGVHVGVCVRPSLDILVAILAIWKARGVYLPLDPTHPEALVGRMLEEAKPCVVLTHAPLSALTRPERFPQLLLDDDGNALEAFPSSSPARASEGDLEDAAYLLYTSGTTGRPKGVVATQANLAHYIHAAQQRYGFGASDVFSSLARYTFSISLFDLVSPLCCGGSVRIVGRDEILSLDSLVRTLQEVTVVHAGPSLLGSLFRHLRAASPDMPKTFPRMRHASTGGDLVPPSVMEEMTRVFANAEVFVIYGCTEISCMGTTFPVPRGAKQTRSFVGKPFPDTTVRVLDPKRQLVPFGVVGEICFAGKGIVRGYLQQPELTAEKFVMFEGQRFYQTGDMGRLHPDGNVEILGRRDFQVQLRGIRVELVGIENTARELGLAAQCAVVAKKVDEGDVRLVAFVVKPRDASTTSFRRALSAHLPDYMLPQSVVVLDAMPVTANGKLDRNRLIEMPWEAARSTAPRALPESAAEKAIAAVFCRVLEVREVGVDESFFDLGGHSLLAVIAIHEIEAALGVTLSPYVLFECATVRSLAAQIGSSSAAESRPILLNERVGAPPLFLLSGIHIYRQLARRLEGLYPVYGVFAGSELGKVDASTVTYTVPELARAYVTMIRREQPEGPYHLLGYSFAGIVAYEVTQQLRAAGQEVRFLALVDAVLPEWVQGWKFRLAQLQRAFSARPRDLFSFVSARLRQSIRPARSEFVRYGADSRVGPLEAQRDEINLRASADYMARMRPIAGPVTLIASGERLRVDPLKSRSGGWSPFIPSLDLEMVDADHFRMLSEDPYVSQLAAILVKRLRSLG